MSCCEGAECMRKQMWRCEQQRGAGVPFGFDWMTALLWHQQEGEEGGVGGGGNVASAATEIELQMIQTTMRRRFSVSHELFLHGPIYLSDTPCLRSKTLSGRRNSLGTCSKMNSRTFVLMGHEEINFGLFFFSLKFKLFSCMHVFVAGAAVCHHQDWIISAHG